jgi:hypothetical protein
MRNAIPENTTSERAYAVVVEHPDAMNGRLLCANQPGGFALGDLAAAGQPQALQPS